MTDLSALIVIAEKTTAPDRWLDARIDAALRIGSEKMLGDGAGYDWAWDNFPVWAHHTHALGMCGVQHANGDLGLIWDSQPFTSSIDAAVALAERVLPGEPILMGAHQSSQTLPWARVGKWSGPDTAAKTLSLAVVLATLRALQSKGEA